MLMMQRLPDDPSLPRYVGFAREGFGAELNGSTIAIQALMVTA